MKLETGVQEDETSTRNFNESKKKIVQSFMLLIGSWRVQQAFPA